MEVRSNFENKVLAAFVAAVLVVAALATTTWKLSQDAFEAARQVLRTHELLEAVEIMVTEQAATK